MGWRSTRFIRRWRLGLPAEQAQRVLRCLRDLGFTLDSPYLHDGAALLAGLEEFRQHLGGRLTLTMLADIGRPVEVHEVDERLMREAIETVAVVSICRGSFSGPRGRRLVSRGRRE